MQSTHAAMLTSCENEPINTPGMIQPHGVLLAISGPDFVITDISLNAASVFGYAAKEMLKTPLANWLSESQFKRLASYNRDDAWNVLQPITLQIAPRRRAKLVKRRRWDIFVHRHDDKLLLEFEPAISAKGTLRYYNLLRKSLGQIHAAATAPQLCHAAAAVVRDLTGFDRVMVYRFDEDWNGEVVAEARREDLAPYLNHHFPASDIPRQARATFLSNWVRMIPDACQAPVALLSVSGDKLNMERSLLRAVSPIHLTYLQNMGTRATLTITLKTGKGLWGLIACHHETPRNLSYGARLACELVGKSASALLPSSQQKQGEHFKKKLRRASAKLVARVEEFGTLRDGLGHNPTLLLGVVAAEGAAVRVDANEKWLLTGRTPPRETLAALAQWLSQQMGNDKLFSTNQLSQHYDGGDAMQAEASGVLAITIPQSENDFILWFRPEASQTKVWAGDPRKQVTTLADGTLKIEPRRSFESWKEQVRFRSRPWTDVEHAVALELRANLVSAELGRQFRLAQQAVQMRDTFLSIASHELKTPLTSMQLQSDMVRRRMRGKRSMEAQEFQRAAASVDKVGEGMSRLIRLVDDMLDVSRINTGQMNMRYAVEDVVSVVDGVVDRMQVQFDNAGVSLTSHPGERIESKMDRLRIEQVLGNLLSNALRYGSGAPVSVETGKQDDTVRITVCDKGPGIATADQRLIFRKYKSASAEPKGAGLGLGLHICKHIVEEHGGSITLRSAEGQGSAFTITLPIAKPSSERY